MKRAKGLLNFTSVNVRLECHKLSVYKKFVSYHEHPLPPLLLKRAIDKRCSRNFVLSISTKILNFLGGGAELMVNLCLEIKVEPS